MKYNFNTGRSNIQNELETIWDYEAYVTGYENSSEEGKKAVKDALLDKKHRMEKLNVSTLTQQLQDIFGVIYEIPKNWWMSYEHLSGLNDTDEVFIEKMVSNNDPDFGWQAAVCISPEAVQKRINLISEIIFTEVEKIEYVKDSLYNTITCADDKEQAQVIVEDFLKESLRHLVDYLYDMSECPDFFSKLYSDSYPKEDKEIFLNYHSTITIDEEKMKANHFEIKEEMFY